MPRAHTHACTHIHTHAHTHTRTHACMHAHTCTHTCAHTHEHTGYTKLNLHSLKWAANRDLRQMMCITSMLFDCWLLAKPSHVERWMLGSLTCATSLVHAVHMKVRQALTTPHSVDMEVQKNSPSLCHTQVSNLGHCFYSSVHSLWPASGTPYQLAGHVHSPNVCVHPGVSGGCGRDAGVGRVPRNLHHRHHLHQLQQDADGASGSSDRHCCHWKWEVRGGTGALLWQKSAWSPTQTYPKSRWKRGWTLAPLTFY